ncbi:MAG: DUF4242 domain-containing protein [Gammaproteobacteria bacterium]|nr:DUF4242 domain-containing protein [Gammaproteobacteria bacterium]
MSVYMVERKLPGISMEQLGAAQQAAIETAREFTAGGKPVTYIRSTYVPEEARCMCLFEAQSAADVESLNRSAQIPFERVVAAHDLTP